MKKMLELVEKNYDKNEVIQFKEVVDNIKLAQTVTTQKALFFTCYKKGVEGVSLLLKIKIDMGTLLASLCLNLVKNNLATAEQLGLNKEVVKLIEDTTHFENIKYDKSEDVSKLRAMFVSMVRDIRSLIIKLADITVTVLQQKPNEKNAQLDAIHKEIKEIYAPLAARLGLSFMKSVLQDENLKYLEPEVYYGLEDYLKKDALQREIALNKTIKHLKKMLQDLNITGQVYGRIKHISSIHNKMLGRAGGNIKNVFDIAAIRIIVEKDSDCYTALGYVHTLYTPVENLFRDYIAKPKANGYRSLHTTVYVENKQIIEVQIRTQEMHDFAEYGVAAHWLYKENKNKQNNLDKKLTWIRHIIENADSLSAGEMIDELKTNVYEGEIYVQTPKGNIIELPVGATAVDFAYNIHSEVGNKCIGAKVNGKMVPLSTQLNTGEIVEIITSTNAKGPSRDWLKFVKSLSARSKINAYFKKEFKEENIRRGKSMLEQAAKTKTVPLHKLLDERYLKDLFEKYSLKSLDDMYASLGHGALSTTQVLNRLIRLFKEEDTSAQNIVIKSQPQAQNSAENKQDVIVITGLDNVLTRFAKCCTPIPGDEVVAYVSRGRGATIHRTNCKTLLQLEQERFIRAEWGDIENATYQAEINIIIKNVSGALAAVTNKIAELNVNIISLNSNAIANERTLVNLTVIITEKEQLSLLMNKLKTLNAVYEVYRSNEKNEVE
jgi:GTP pyrophosphokinase